MAAARLLTDLTAATMNGAGYGLIPDAGIAVEDARIAWVGPAAECPAPWRDAARESLGGRLVTPALIDCHTHVVHGGNRAREFEMRLEGASYEEVARAGGGILSTVKATRAAGEDELVAAALPRIDAMLAEGVSLIEVKSGYGLDRDTELRMLRAARRIAEVRQVRIVTSFLGAHAVPPEFSGNPDDYIDDMASRHCAQPMPKVWWTRWMGSAKASRSIPRRSPACSMWRENWVCR